ncbi:MAG TPA: DUF899 family protein [Ignavibacteria bacterium]|jgi:predicted dithiol-disulfide oxidoreductase (DUF899 family)
MGKKAKKNKRKKTSGNKLEKKLQKIEQEIRSGRKKMIKILSKIGRMDEVEDYELKDWNGNLIKLSAMFGDKNDLILVHNMGKACSYCTLWADGFNGTQYFTERKAGFAVVSPDPPDAQKEFALSRGWKFRMYSGHNSPFIKDMGYQTETGDYWPGVSVFHRDENGKISRIAKDFFGPGDFYCSVFHFLDMLPANGKQEDGD